MLCLRTFFIEIHSTLALLNRVCHKHNFKLYLVVDYREYTSDFKNMTLRILSNYVFSFPYLRESGMECMNLFRFD